MELQLCKRKKTELVPSVMWGMSEIKTVPKPYLKTEGPFEQKKGLLRKLPPN